MKKYFFLLLSLTISLLFSAVSTLNAQTVVKTWDFESGSLSPWAFAGAYQSGTAPTGGVVTPTGFTAHGGTHVVQAIKGSGCWQINLQLDGSTNIQSGDSLAFWVYPTVSDTTHSEAYQVFWQDNNWANWNSVTIPIAKLKANQWNQVGLLASKVTSPLNRIGIQTYPKATHADSTAIDTIYIDDITVYRPAAAILSYTFESNNLGDTFPHIGWAQTDVQSVVVNDPYGTGNKVMKNTIHNYNAAPVLKFVLPSGKTLADYGSFTFKGYFAQGDVGYKSIVVEAYQTMPTGQAFSVASNAIGSYSRALNGSTAWENITVNTPNTSTFHDTIYIAFGINCAGTGSIGAAGDTTVWYADNVTLVPKGPAVDTTLVAQWGKTSLGTAWPLIPNATAGSIGIGNGKVPTAWSTVSGHFSPLTATSTQAVVVSGQMQLVGGGGASAYTWLRYGLTFQDSARLSNAGTDSALWVSSLKNYGYQFDPISGSGAMANSSAGQGTVWTVLNGNWTSSYSNGGIGPIAAIRNQPYNAEAIAGTYNFAISVTSINDTTNELRWYLVEQNNKYWFGGTIQVTATSKKFNALSFGFNNDFQGTQVNFTNVTAKMGAPITVPEAPFQSFYVNKWGSTPLSSSLNGGWKILNDSTYIDGDAAMGGAAVPTGWATIKGGFQQSVNASLSKAIVVTGKLEFVGKTSASAYTWLRYSLFSDSGVVSGQNTDTAKWTSSNGNGYIFTPVTGSGAISNTYRAIVPNQGTEWALINSKSWTSTNSNGGGAFSTVLQQPYHQEATPGVYDWAISVQPLAGGGNQINWYLIQEHATGTNNYYWWGGSFIDTAKAAPTSFNSIGFACNNDVGATEIKITDVNVNLGSLVTVPEAPFQSFFVNKWGSTPLSANLNGGWKILNDSTYIDGDAAMGGTAVPTGWTTIKGGFQQSVTAKITKALVVTGKLEFVGKTSGSAYTWLRYSLFSDSGVISGQNTDTAKWTSSNGNGYIFTPVTGSGAISNTYRAIVPNQGTEWALVNSKSWTSTNSNGGGAFSTILQQPYHQEATPGVYDWAISVQPLASGGNQVNWYFIQEHATGSTNYYWWGGSFIDTAVAAPASFNSIAFACNNDVGATEVKITDVNVNLGTSINVPKPPFQSFYISQWGFYGGKMGGWQYTPGDLTGDATISGSAAIPASGWSAIRGGFDSPVTPYSKDTALVVTGQVEFDGGGFTSAGSLRFGLFFSDSAGVVDTTMGIDSTKWSGTDNHNHGYLFIPTSGSNAISAWSGLNKSGTWGAVSNDVWLSTSGAADYILGNNVQSPLNADGSAGKYNFAISVAPQGNGTQIVTATIYKSDSSYYWTGSATDNNSSLVTTKFNSLMFALGGGNTTTALKLTNVNVDLKKPLGAKVTDVNSIENGVPVAYALSQNYPNPFNPSTMINFALPKSGNVSLKVYDILGREVSTLVDGNMNAGYHQVNFNASKLASGVYFYRLTAGDFVSVKKLMLLK
jgi:hypothetical protein